MKVCCSTMRLQVLVTVIGTLVSVTTAIKCYQCTNNEDNCNSGNCEGDWCVARYITKNPFANDHEKRVTKSCEKAHPIGYNNDSCVESISPSGRKLSCGCQRDYCNDDKAIQKLPVESHDDGGPASGNSTSVQPSSGGDLVDHSNSLASGVVRCICNEDKYCVNGECKGVACTTEFYDETGVSAGAGVRLGVRISKGCTTLIPDEVRDNQVVKPTTVTLPDGKTAETRVTIFYCKDRDYCNTAGVRSHALVSWLVILVPLSVLFMAA